MIAPDLAALQADPLYLHVTDAPCRDVPSLCGQAEQALDALNDLYEQRSTTQMVSALCARRLAYARYAIGNARRTLDDGDGMSSVAQIADAGPRLRMAWDELLDTHP